MKRFKNIILGILVAGVLTVAGVCVVGFIVAGFVQNVYITWAVSFALMLCVLFVIRSMERRKAA